jgi:anti-sigma B factor antagonist
MHVPLLDCGSIGSLPGTRVTKRRERLSGGRVGYEFLDFPLRNPTMTFGVRSAPISDAAAVIDLTGEVDLYTAPELKQELLRVIDEGATFVIVDLTETTFIDSTTLGVLLGTVKRVRPLGGSVVLVCSNRNIRKIFEITLLDRVFTIVDTREEALAELDRLSGLA